MSVESPLGTPAESPPRVIVCDDSPTIRATIVAMLGKGFDFLVLTSAEEVLEQAAAFGPDLILSDLLMEGINGYELCRRLRAEPTLRQVPVILLTAKTDDDSRATGLEVGADDYLFKPVRPRELKARVASLVRLHRTTRALEQSRREVRDILHNIQQAVFTVGPDLRIRGEHSSFVSRIFGEGVPFAEQLLPVLLAPDDEQGKNRERLESWLKVAFTQTQVDWEILTQLVDKEYTYRRPTDGERRELVLEFRPIREGNRIHSLMVVAEDVTDTRALQRTLEQRTRENEDNIEQISEFIQVDPEIFDNFLTEAEQTLAQAQQALAELRTADSPQEVVAQLFRGMHALKGNARSFRLNLIAAKAHWVEDTFARLREEKSIGDDVLEETRTRLGDLEELLRRARSLAHRVLHPRTSRAGPQGKLSMLSVSRLQLNQLRQWVSELKAAPTPELVGRLEQSLQAISRVPFQDCLVWIPEMAVELSRELGKKPPTVRITGGDTLLVDPTFVEALHPTLVQLVSNAVDHGLERPEARLAAGKPEEGLLRIDFATEGSWLVLTVQDDGRGLDGQALKDRAIDLGQLTAERAATLSPGEAQRLIFLSGVSTAGTVTQVSGRGVGMDAVRESLGRLGGDIGVESSRGVGTTFRMRIPLELVEGRRPAPLGQPPPAPERQGGAMTARFFGQYLLEKGLISAEQLLRATDYQATRNLPWLEFAQLAGFLTAAQAQSLDDPHLGPDRNLGEVAVERGLLTREQLGELLSQQARSHVYIGDAAVLTGALTEEVVARELSHYRAELESSELGTPEVAPGMPFGKQVGELAELTGRFLQRTTGVLAKVDGVTVGAAELPEALVEVSLGLKGAVEGRYILRAPKALASRVAEGMLGFAVEAEADMADAISEFANLVAGNFCAKLAVYGLRSELTPPTSTMPAPPRSILGGSMVALYLVHTAHGRMEVLFTPRGSL